MRSVRRHPDNDTTFTFLVSLLYSQIFQTPYYCADQIHHGALPCHVHFILDEAPSVNLRGCRRSLRPCAHATSPAAPSSRTWRRSRSCIRTRLMGNHPRQLGHAALSGRQRGKHPQVHFEALGKSTIDTKTHGQTKGRSGSYSTNFQISGRELLTPDEVRMLDNRYCILFIRAHGR